MNDTICAISTAMGVGGISIIRVSGDEAIEIVSKIFKGKDLLRVESHTINYGHIVFENEVIDEVLVSVMRAPKTYTVEDVVEIDLHGGIATTNRVLEILLLCGARLAEPGEFTKRAFLNGRIDLIEAEAVGELIVAENENARTLSVNHLMGELSLIVRNLKERIISLEAAIEVNIDYPEYEDIEDMTNEKVLNELESIATDVKEMIRNSQTGKIVQNGLNVALIGKPNVGKSSILNRLLEEDKAIVTDVAGTTRDIVEGKMIMNGFTINFIDTAGIRKTDDLVEKIGVDKSLEQIERADLIIMVLNNAEKIEKEEKDLLKKIGNRPHIVFINKNDLPNGLTEKFTEAVYGNTISKDGLDSLKEKMMEIFSLNAVAKKDFTYMSNARQLAIVKKVDKSIDEAIESLKRNMPVDIVASDLADARKGLAEILGEVYDEELIDTLFARFCLGK